LTDTADELIAAAQTPGRFDADTAVRALPDGALAAGIDPRWSVGRVGRGVNGGYLVAMLLRALTRAVDDLERSPRSLTVHFLKPVTGETVHIEPRGERRGGLMTTASARMTQEDGLVALALAAFSGERPDTPEFCELTMPAVAPPDAVGSVVFNPAFMPKMTTCWETKVVGPQPFSGGDRAQFSAWQRLPEGRPWDALSVAAMCDAVIPAITPRLLPARFAFPSIDLTIHFRNPVPDSVTGEDFLLGHHRTRLSAGGFFEQDAQIWTAGGVLIAQARQLMALLDRHK